MNMNYVGQSLFFPGSLVDSGFTDKISIVAGIDTAFGMPVVRQKNTEINSFVRNDIAYIKFPINLVEGEGEELVITGNVNNIPFADVPWETSNAATLAHLAVHIVAALGSGFIASYNAPNNWVVVRAISAVDKVETAQATSTYTPGEGPVVVTEAVITYESTDVFDGVSVFQHKVEKKYVAKEPMSVLRKGRIFASVSGSVNRDDFVYLNTADGKFTNQPSGNVPTGLRFCIGSNTNNVAAIQL